MDFVGTGKRLNVQDLLDAADKLTGNVATIRAVLEVEAAGAGLTLRIGRGSCSSRIASTSSSDLAQSATEPSRKAWPIPRAGSIDETAALNSASWGLPQIMGFNYRAAGFPSAKAMVTSMMQGEREQLLAFVNLLIDWKLAETLGKHDWRTIALKYNGPNALKNGYDKKLQKAFDKFSALAAKAVEKPGTNRTFVFPSAFSSGSRTKKRGSR